MVQTKKKFNKTLKNIDFPTCWTKVVALWLERANKQFFKGGLNFIVFPNIELSHRNLFIHIFYAWLQLVPQVLGIPVNKHFICKVNTDGGGENNLHYLCNCYRHKNLSNRCQLNKLPKGISTIKYQLEVYIVEAHIGIECLPKPFTRNSNT